MSKLHNEGRGLASFDGNAWPTRTRAAERVPSTHRCTSVTELVETWGAQVRWAARRSFYDQWHRFMQPSWWARLSLPDILQGFWADVTRYQARFLAADDQRNYLSRAVAAFVRQQVREWPGFDRQVHTRGKTRTWHVTGGTQKFGITLGEDYKGARLNKAQTDELLDRTAFDAWQDLRRRA